MRYILRRMMTKRLRSILIVVVLVSASIASFVGMLTQVEWLQRVGVVLLLIIGIIAVTDWMRASAH